MIKIIKPGVLPEEVTRIYQGECPECNAVIEYDRDNLSQNDPYQAAFNFLYVPCPTPCCKGQIMHKNSKIKS